MCKLLTNINMKVLFCHTPSIYSCSMAGSTSGFYAVVALVYLFMCISSELVHMEHGNCGVQGLFVTSWFTLTLWDSSFSHREGDSSLS